MAVKAAAKEGERQGDLLIGKYLLEDCLGIGGMGEVYRATNVSLGRKVAIKVLNKEHTANEDDVLRFLREARAAAAVRHPNVVDVLDVARDDDGTPFIVQELLSGEDLEQYLSTVREGCLPAKEALEIMIPVAEAVAAAHAGNVVHRDLKPANIFLAREGTKLIPKVLDFGACLYQTVGVLSAKERRMLIGTPHYMAPEQITTAMEVDERADIWALGVILYELIAGETPFEAPNADAVMKLVRTRDVPRLRKVVPTATPMLEQLVMSCLDRDRKKRFANAGILRSELEKVRVDLEAATRSKVATLPELDDSDSKAKAAAPAKAPPAKAPPAKAEGLSATKERLDALAQKPGRLPTKRRRAALLTLSGPDEEVKWDSDPPASSPRKIDPRADADSEPPKRQQRTAADVIRQAEASSVTKESSPGRSAVAQTLPSQPSPTSALSAPSSSRGTGAASATSATSSRDSRAEPPEPGSARGVDVGGLHDAMDLDLEPPPSRPVVVESSIPPVLDPRSATGPTTSQRLDRSDGPPPSSAADKPRASQPTSDGARSARAEVREASLSPPISPPSVRPPRPAAVPIARPERPRAAWSTAARVRFGLIMVLPAAVAFVVLRFAPFITAPLGHAMRGDTPLASGVLAVVTLVAAAALAARSLGSSRSTPMLIATIGAVLLGIVMIIVTFSASETVESGIPPAAAAIVPFIAPIVPLGLAIAAFNYARSMWLSPYERREAITFLVAASLMLFAVLEVGPLGAVRRLAQPGTPAPAVNTN